MSDSGPIISIFIPYYNDKTFLKNSIQSVLNQSYKLFELILVNHASTDNCREIAHSFDDDRIRHIDIPSNLGAGSGVLISEFLKIAKGKYVKFFCADDILFPNGLRLLVDYMESHPRVDLGFGNVEYIDLNENSLGRTFFEHRPFFSLNNTEEDCVRLFVIKEISFLPYIGCIIKRQSIDSIEIDKSMIMLLDMSIWLSLLLKGYKLGYLNEIIGGYRIHEGQMSSLTSTELASRRHSYEKLPYRQLICKYATDVSLIKTIFSHSEYIDNLNYKEDIPFIVHQYYLSYHGCSHSYSFLHDLLEDDTKRMILKERFCYGIRELRQDYSKAYSLFPSEKGKKEKPKWKLRLRSTSIDDLGFLSICYLLLRKIYFIFSFRSFFKNRKKKKSYSL